MAILPYSGGSRRNIRLPHEPAEPEEPAKPAPEVEEPESEVEEPESGEETGEPAESEQKPFHRGKYSRSRGRVSAAKTVSVSGDATGFLLALLFWGWVALPFFRAGTTGVKDTWRAKFLNKGPHGEWLP